MLALRRLGHALRPLGASVSLRGTESRAAPPAHLVGRCELHLDGLWEASDDAQVLGNTTGEIGLVFRGWGAVMISVLQEVVENDCE